MRHARALGIPALLGALALVLLLTTRDESPHRALPNRPEYAGAALANAMRRAMYASADQTPPPNWRSAAFWTERARNLVRPERMARTDWHAGVFWIGVLAAYRATGDEAYYDAARSWAQRTKWRIGPEAHELADRLVVGQVYAEMYEREKRPFMIADLKTNLQRQFRTEAPSYLERGGGDMPLMPKGRDVFWWCDALFMAPPVLAQLGTATGNSGYFRLLHAMYWDAKEHLFDERHQLFFHNAAFFPERRTSPGGKPIFWGRGNGWVYAGLIRTLDALPPDDEHRQQYVDLFRAMTRAILQYQQPDGMWRASLIEPEWVPSPESTSTALFTFGLLAGINRGYLDRETYLPPARRAWAGLWSLVNHHGGVEYAQGPANAPKQFSEHNVTPYGQGAFLLAASELYRMQLGS